MKKAKQPVEDLQTVLEGLTLDDGTAGDDATEDEAIRPKCGKLLFRHRKRVIGLL